MSEELGSINKPEAGDILQKTKAYIVTLVQAQPGAPEGFEEKYNKYWEAIEVHLSQIEAKAGVVNKIFCEGIVGKGDDAKLMLEQSNPGAHNIVRRRISSGANFEEFEDKEILGQLIDWSRCLQVGLINQKVVEEVHKNYTSITEKRTNFIQSQLEKNITESDSILLIVGNTAMNIPENVEKFIISPPELDELERWVNETNEAIRKQMEQQQQQQQQPEPRQDDKSQDDGSGNSKLWTPG
ncbi:MAG: hypothetical protein ACJ0G8_03570 [Dehalococcoidia bacterium]